jgi:ubiquinone/menaquinone biosynthesis C-methylase UbiE
MGEERFHQKFVISMSSWDKGAKTYDQFLPVTQHYAKKIISWHQEWNLSPVTILDVACGTGSFAHLAAHEYPQAFITAVDYSQGMVDILKAKSQELQLATPISALVQDGQNMDAISSDTFDLSVSIFGLIFFPDRTRGWQELYRVTKPGGHVFVATWKDPDSLNIVEQAIERITGKPPIPTNEMLTVRSCADPHKTLNEIKASAAFSQVEYRQEIFEWKLPLDQVTTMFEKMDQNPVIQSAMEGHEPAKLHQVLNQLLQERTQNGICTLTFDGLVFRMVK